MSIFKYTPEALEAVEEWSGIMSAPSPRNRKRMHGIKVFSSPFLEKWFGTSHPILPGIWFLPVIGYGVYVSATSPLVPAKLAVGLFALGILLWTLFEYLLHRFAFHLKPGPSFKARFNGFMMHGYHHEFPNDKGRLVAPPVMSWPLAVIIGSVFYFALGPDVWLALYAGFVAGYLGYDWIHYYTHHFRPTTRLGKFLRRYHMEHHFKDSSTHFGISNPLWDLVFGTYSRPTAPSKLEVELIGGDEPAPQVMRQAS